MRRSTRTRSRRSSCSTRMRRVTRGDRPPAPEPAALSRRHREVASATAHARRRSARRRSDSMTPDSRSRALYSFLDWDALAALTAEVRTPRSPIRTFERAVDAVITGEATVLREMLSKRSGARAAALDAHHVSRSAGTWGDAGALPGCQRSRRISAEVSRQCRGDRATAAGGGSGGRRIGRHVRRRRRRRSACSCRARRRTKPACRCHSPTC